MDNNEKNTLLKQTNAIVYLSILVLLLIVVVLFITFCHKSQQLGCATPEPIAVCGNAVSKANKDPKGNTLFKQNCAVCHSVTNLKLTGPGLKGVAERVPQPTAEWLEKKIRNSTKLRLSGDAYSLKLYKENGERDMSSFDSTLTNDEIKTLVNYVMKLD